MQGNPIRRVSLIAVVTVMCLTTALTSVYWSMHAHAATGGPGLVIDVAAGRHSISSDIYGMEGPDSTLQKDIKLPMQREGGDGGTNYNWLQDSTNYGNDFYYIGGNNTANPVAGASVDQLVNDQLAVGGHSLVTVPIIGYVNKSSQWNCSYPTSAYPGQQVVWPYVTLANGDQCGNGKDSQGNQIPDTDLSRNYLQVDPTWMQAWIQHLVQTHGNSATSGITYELDNEPGNWRIVHTDIHPEPTGYDELTNDTIKYAQMIKATDPTAQTMGPSDGYSYAYVHLDLQDKPGDGITSHNGMPWIPYYLQQMKNYEQQHGTRLLDYLDVHYYGDQSSNDDNATTNAARLDSTRALWDPTYNGPNSLGQYLSPPQKVGQIQALKNWINQYYPGTKLSISEYDFGAHKTLNGALTQADVLGIFGREGLDSANLWNTPTATDPTAYTYRLFLNYDGNGGRFGDTSFQASSTDQGKLSIYGAQRSSDNATTMVVINKTGNDLTSNLAINNFAAGSSAQMYTYSGANLNAIVRQPDLAVSNNSLTATFPANSMTMIVLPKGDGSTATPTPTPTPETNLLNNAGFESGNLGPWNKTGNAGVEATSPHSGSYDAYLYPSAIQDVSLTQTITAPETRTYTLTGYANVSSQNVQFGADVDGQQVRNIDILPSSTGYQKYTTTFSVNAGQKITVWYYAHPVDGWAILDDVSLE
ncbi:hypothetical protein KDA_51810 [Dictyobacter alpinus]|uniref:Glycoside hydrolase family 44 domain-containing protein n=1 Tax=Dictyobacter alpinus TaxID=2014873 RepID=A0A402BEL2_9CHLR|nr:glycoside hydrolase family 44 protein [Dictyobacter alpinus]GCE29697.1 hypothetical protein KDA_51810 [Dictyobacter alpinus]